MQKVDQSLYDVIVVGGSFSGLSASLGLARALFKVLVIDSGERCNKNVIEAHNFLTHDGAAPADLHSQAKAEVSKYKSVEFLNGRVVSAAKKGLIFEVTTEAKEKLTGRKLLFTTGLKDKIPAIPGLAECWGRSAFHCPFCHAYELKGQSLGVLVPDERELHFVRLIHHINKNLKIFINGPSNMSPAWMQKFEKAGIPIYQSEIERVEHEGTQIKHLVLKDGSRHAMDAYFFRPPMEQQTSVPKEIGCNINETGLIQVDDFFKTNVPGVFASGDSITIYRALAITIGAGLKCSSFITKELVEENFGNL